MSQPRPFEGIDAEQLVVEIRRELGPDARIVRGETVRSGGVLGFFAKEKYRLFAEPAAGGPPPESGPQSRGGAGTRRPAALLPAPVASTGTLDVFAALAEHTADLNDVLADGVGTAPGAAPAAADAAASSRHRGRRSPLRRPAAISVAAGPAHAFGTAPFETGAFTGGEFSPDAPATPAPPAGSSRLPTAPDTADDFGAVLREVTRILDAQPDAAATVITASTSGQTEPAAAAPAAQATPEPAAAEPAAAKHAAPKPAVRKAAAPKPAAPKTAVRKPAASKPAVRKPAASKASTAQPGTARAAVPATREAATRRRAASRAATPAAAPPARRTPVDRRGPAPRNLRSLLRSTGLSDADAAAAAALVRGGHDLSVALTHTFAALAPTPPQLRATPGRPLVVVGGAGPALQAAGELALDNGLDPDDVTVVTAASLPETSRAITVVDLPVAPRPLGERALAVSDLRPATVVGVVDSVTKVDDVAAWAEALGGLDALVLVNVEGTLSPAAVLQTGIPVARLGAHHANPARWAATVTDLVEGR
ncbi:hypothetical protein K6U06_11755 [Acidiferrimicrobium sp. IK]|uniref:hypothetical protein n=1 Tax=Acidiferrimicrobium sp. IK TaxID=2871700 RepID=UPI0021CB25E2|nr:hypothetical protein [Acidiferrimicrobium sp. IK]MCU4185038.1 hypothetical protein [Acidiferrimicrobium sp. IK]